MSRVPLERKILSENDRIASRLRERFHERQVFCLNFISSPGAGKTSLLERTLERFNPNERVALLTGDIQTDNDARRLARFGFPVKQITTGGACHLDARMIERVLADWPLKPLDMLLIENVGNLVCPSSYDLGEAAKVVVLSVAEGEDKPLKYPAIFFKAELLVLTKTDLLPYVTFDIEKARAYALEVHPGMEIVELSCKTGAGVDDWMKWLARRRESAKDVARASRPDLSGSRPLSRERPAPARGGGQDERPAGAGDETPAPHRQSSGQA
jgi:hydrogenase nickel incorporation protein HypB